MTVTEKNSNQKLQIKKLGHSIHLGATAHALWITCLLDSSRRQEVCAAFSRQFKSSRVQLLAAHYTKQLWASRSHRRSVGLCHHRYNLVKGRWCPAAARVTQCVWRITASCRNPVA